MFHITLEPVTDAKEGLREAAVQLKKGLAKMQEAEAGLKRFSYMEAPLKNLERLSQRAEEEISQSMQMIRTLETIQELYFRGDRTIADYCEGITASTRREKADIPKFR